MILFLDLETSHLDPARAHILELGAILVDDDLLEVRRWEALLARPPVVHMLDTVDMHRASGLLALLEERPVFDRSMLREHMPTLHAWLSHRMIDVSTIRELMKRWSPSVHAAMPAANSKHRAMADCEDAIGTLAAYRRELWRGPR